MKATYVTGTGNTKNTFLGGLKELFCGFDFPAGSSNLLCAYDYFCYLMVRTIILISSYSSRIKAVLLLLIF